MDKKTDRKDVVNGISGRESPPSTPLSAGYITLPEPVILTKKVESASCFAIDSVMFLERKYLISINLCGLAEVRRLVFHGLTL